MTNEEKQLLIIDLCNRLPHRKLQCQIDLKGYLEWNPEYRDEFVKASKIRPNLFEKISNEKYTLYGLPCWDRVHFLEFWGDSDYGVPVEYVKPYLRPMSSMTEEEVKEYKHLVAFSGSPEGAANFIDWLNKKMFDYRGLIERNLALEAPDGMYNLNEE